MFDDAIPHNIYILTIGAGLKHPYFIPTAIIFHACANGYSPKNNTELKQISEGQVIFSADLLLYEFFMFSQCS